MKASFLTITWGGVTLLDENHLLDENAGLGLADIIQEITCHGLTSGTRKNRKNRSFTLSWNSTLRHGDDYRAAMSAALGFVRDFPQTIGTATIKIRDLDAGSDYATFTSASATVALNDLRVNGSFISYSFTLRGAALA